MTTGRGLEPYQLDISAALHVFSANFTNDADKETCPCCEAPKPGSTAKKAPTVEDKYILKDVLGT